MSTAAGRRYGEALERLKHSNHADYRAVKNRVESWRTIADKWRDRAEVLERRLADLTDANGNTEPNLPTTEAERE